MTTIRRNDEGRRELLNSPDIASALRGVAELVAEEMRREAARVTDPGEPAFPIVVDEQETDRERAVVSIRHPAGVALMAKHALDLKAFSALGLRAERP